MTKKILLLFVFAATLLLAGCDSDNSTSSYRITMSAVPGDAGSVSPGSGTFQEGYKLKISAKPVDNSWRFDHWSGDLQGNNATMTITVHEARNIKAHFVENKYNLSIKTEGQGSVTQKVVSTPSASGYSPGTVVELMAKPAKGWKFVKFTGDLSSTDNPATLTVDKAKEVTAVFEKQSYDLTVNTNGQGTVDQKVVQKNAVANYKYDTTVQLTAKAATGWEFVKWTGDLTGSKNPDQITINDPKEVTAVFKKKTFALTLKTEGNGTVTKDPDLQNYAYKTSVKLTAKPAKGWKFVKFTGDLSSTDNPATLTVDKAKEVTAVFEKQSYDLTVNTNGQGTVNQKVIQKNAVANYKYDTTVQLTAKAATGWEFVKWTGDLTGSKNPDQITINDPKEVTAVFQKKGFALTVKTEGEGTVAKDPDQQNYAYKTSVKLTAKPAKGWKFVKFTGDLTTTDNPATLTVDKAKEVTAVFEKQSYTLTVSTEGHGSVSKSPDQPSYAYETKVTVTANPDNGWSFKQWEGDLSGTDKTLSVTMDANKTGKAVFEKVNLFYLGSNGVTIKCPDANVGDTGTVGGVTYTKRSRNQIDPSNAETTCTSSIKYMYQIFENASSFNGDISSWDVSSVTDMSQIFNNAKSFNQDLSNWDVSSVTRMGFMFSDASSFNGDISSWDVSSVTNMDRMFGGAKSFNQDLNDWDVSKVTNMGGMFSGANSFNGDISGWDVSGVTDISGMFIDAKSFNQDLNNWNVSNVTNMGGMFDGASSFNGDISGWNVDNVKYMGNMFNGASNFNGDIGGWDVVKVVDMRAMFSDASSFNQDLAGWDVSSVTSMDKMFYNATSFNGDLSGWDGSRVTDMNEMFSGASSFNGDLNGWDVSSVTNMAGMFYRAGSFNGNISSWKVGNVTVMRSMFRGASSFNQDLSGWDVSSVTDVEYMFDGATNFNRDIGSWDVSGVTAERSMRYMFENASSFNQDLSGWCVSNIASEPYNFALNSPLTNDNKPKWGTCPAQ